MMEYYEGVPIVAMLVLFMGEHVGRLRNIPYIRTSYYLGGVVSILRRIARKFGVVYAYIATFPSVIQLWEIYQTLVELMDPIGQLPYVLLEYRSAVLATSTQIASVDSMRLGTTLIVWFAIMVYLDRLHEFYIIVSGFVMAMLFIIHILATMLIKRNGQDAPKDVRVEDPKENQMEFIDSPPVRRRKNRGEIVAAT